VLDIIARIKIAEADHRALDGAEDVGEAETTLVLVPGANRRRREVALTRAFRQYASTGQAEHRCRSLVPTCFPNGTKK
jgi:hypothetical protein